MKKVSLVLLALMFSASNVFAQSPRISVVGGVNYGLDKQTATVGPATAEAKGGLGFGGGLLIDSGHFELGALYVSKKQTLSVTGAADTSKSYSVVHIPVMLRTVGGSMTLGAGGFYDAGDSSNYGLTAGPRFGGSGGGLFLDLRFNYGLKDGNTKDILALIGFSLGK
jgi:hypothetical protein